MDYSCKSVLKGDDLLPRKTLHSNNNSDRENKSDGHHQTSNNKMLSFGVDRILASDDKDRNSIIASDMQFLPPVQYMVQNQMDFPTPNGLLINKRLVRPQALRISDNGVVGVRADFPQTQQSVHHHHHQQRIPYPAHSPSVPSMFPPHLHSHLPVLRFNSPLYQKYPMVPQHFLVQPHFAVEDTHRREGFDQGGRSNNQPVNGQTSSKRKRSWSRAVFSNLQRKGLEIAFGGQKYITKPDRRKLAARLGLTDAQVKVWFQNRRMKWRHTGEDRKGGTATNGQPVNKSVKDSKGSPTSEEMYTSSDEESMCEDEIDVMD